jgi:hypothetical protein
MERREYSTTMQDFIILLQVNDATSFVGNTCIPTLALHNIAMPRTM